ncbi:MAG: GumC family protein [Smithella sp.]
MEEQDTIDLRKVMQIAAAYKYRLVAIVLVTTILALIISFVLPKQYESSVLLRAKSQKQTGLSGQAASAVALLGGNMPSPTQTYIEMMKSRSVLEPVMEPLDLPNKEKLDVPTFAKKYLKFQNTKGTDLIEVTASGRTPEEAQQIAAGVVANFQQNLTRLSQSDQSLMVKFLKDRMAIAKQEMEQAEQNLEQFRQQEKIYVPDEQANASIKKLTEYDQKIAQLKVQNDANEARLQGVNDQLNRQNVAISAYNIADNPVIQEIRKQLVVKQISLADAQQRYTDKHPNVILIQNEIDQLNGKLQEEVSNSVQAGTSTLNPLQMGLVQAKAATETELLVGQATLSGLQQVQSRNEQEISQLSADSVTYIGLERQAKIAQEVYSVLVKSYEQTRIQEAMESMDIQIVDEANLPKKPSAPKKILITAVGGVLGIMLSFIYLSILYREDSSSSYNLNRSIR